MAEWVPSIRPSVQLFNSTTNSIAKIGLPVGPESQYEFNFQNYWDSFESVAIVYEVSIFLPII